jgi:hypothetical protein
MTTGNSQAGPPRSVLNSLLIQPAERWYLRPLAQQLPTLTPSQQQSVRRQAVIGVLQTALLLIVIVQVVFAGMLRALPPDLRASLGFMHRIEWGAYLGVILILAQVALSWHSGIVLTNRFYLLAWRFGKPRLVMGNTARIAQIGYLILATLIIGAIVWVRINGFIVQTANQGL